MTNSFFSKFQLRICVLLLFHFCSSALLGQNTDQKVDSLETLLANTTSTAGKINLYRELAVAYRFPNREKEYFYLKKMAAAAKKSNDFENQYSGYARLADHFFQVNNQDSCNFFIDKVLKKEAFLIEKNLAKLVGKSYSLKGKTESRSGDPRKGLVYFDKAGEVYNDENFLMRLYGSKGIVYGILSENNKALGYFTRALEHAEKLGNKHSQGNLKSNIAQIYDDFDDYESSIKLKQEALEIFKELNDERAQLTTTLNLASTYYLMDDQKAIPTLTDAFEKSLKLKDQNSASVAVWQLADKYSKTDFKKAEYYIDRYLELEKDHPTGDYTQAILYGVLANIYIEGKKYPKAAQFAQIAVDKMKVLKKDSTDNYAIALEALSASQFHAGKYASARRLDAKADSIREENFRNSNSEALAKALAQFNVRENEMALEKAAIENQAQIEKAAANRRLYFGLLGAAGLLLIFGFYAYRKSQAANRIIAGQKDLVEKSLKEKEALLKEIHHRVKNNLQIISGLLSKQARKTPDPEFRKMINEGRDRVYSMALVHQNLYQSDNFAAIGIKNYLEELTRNIASTQPSENIEVELNVDDSNLDIDTAIPVGLILNELITNAFKYAFAENVHGKISIDFRKKSEDYFLKVKDNGIGLPTDFDISKTKSLGLSLVKGLVEQLEGSLNFEGNTDGSFFEINFQK